ncbi:MAG: SRPBCC family protein [Candidatus Limnocylindria bacterium]
MPSARHAVTVNRPVGDVFAFVAGGTNARQWRPGVVDVAHVSGEGTGAVYRQGVKGPGGRRIAADYEVTAFEPDRRIAFHAIAGPVRPTGEYAFEANGDQTTVTLKLEAVLTGWKALVMGRPVQATMESEVRNLEALKRILEA